MLLRHVALTCSSEANSDKFYKDLLGLNKLEPKVLPSELSKAIFNLGTELRIINYLDEDLHFEIFLTNPIGNGARQIEHMCLEVDDLSGFMEKCRSLNVDITQIPKGDKTLTFIEDDDGNLFEIMGK